MSDEDVVIVSPKQLRKPKKPERNDSSKHDSRHGSLQRINENEEKQPEKEYRLNTMPDEFVPFLELEELSPSFWMRMKIKSRQTYKGIKENAITR